MERRLPPHPIDERGLAVIPAGISLECIPEQCRYKRQMPQNRQHVYHPRAEYENPRQGGDELKKRFRNLGCNVIRMCRCQHEEWDLGIEPPPMPSRDVMQQVIEEYEAGQYQMAYEEGTVTLPSPRPVNRR